MDELDQALADLAAAEKRVKEIEVDMLRAGKLAKTRGVQADLVRRTGKSREYYRLLAKEHGLTATE
ncbi:hypothetical protein [Nocardia salmonicida]|uniref:hypothetical protein n=1 Tax=Nocardia salmonicida TaxID=53431 RepID=UPI003639D46B